MTECPADARYVARWSNVAHKWVPPTEKFYGREFSSFLAPFKWSSVYARLFEHEGKVYVVRGQRGTVKVYPDLETAKIAVELSL